MRKILVVCLLACPAFAQTNAAKAEVAARAEVKIPAGAVKTDDGTYKYTDAKGKKWLYRETPFGIAKSEDKALDSTATPFGKAVAKPEPEVTPVKGRDPAVAYDEGDTYRFERQTPFGTTVWRKKKTDVNAAEQTILDQQKSKQQ
jgi:hypothetical protein